MTTSPALSLRDRKRLETRSRIEDAAVSLVLRDGLELTTVDAISERANVSPRTFFNYFDSKDSAILGVHQAEASEELMAQHLADHRDDDLIESVVRLLVTVMGASLESRTTIHNDRLELIRRHPGLLGGQVAQLSARAGMLTSTIEELMATSPEFINDDVDRTSHAELMLAICGGAVRSAVREWAADGSLRPVETIETRAVALIKEIVGKLA